MVSCTCVFYAPTYSGFQLRLGRLHRLTRGFGGIAYERFAWKASGVLWGDVLATDSRGVNHGHCSAALDPRP